MPLTFKGVLATWLASGASLEDANVAANAAASPSVGAAYGMPRRDAIEARIGT